MIEKIIKFRRVASTQDTAKKFVRERHELAVMALSQNMGRGRQGRVWFSPKGGLYVSLLLFPKRRPTSIPLLASLSVIKTLETLGFSKLLINWPNDVMLNNRKICGVVCERSGEAVICGIGLNVNVDGFGPRLITATSMSIESGRDFDVDHILENLVHWFNELYDELQQKGLKVKEVLNYIAGLGEPVEVTTTQGVIKGTVSDIDDDWALLLRDESGIIRKFYYGDVKRLQW